MTVPTPHTRVQRLRLTNIRCFDELSVEFGRDGLATDWTLLLGNNGAGKSTLLRALALALTPISDLGPMLHADGESWVRSDEREDRSHGSLAATSGGSAQAPVTTKSHGTIGGRSRSTMGGSAKIEVELLVDQQRVTRVIELTGSGRSTNFVVRGDEDAVIDTEPLVLVGYGAARQLQGTKEFSIYSPQDSTGTLMSTNGSLQNPELAIRRAAGSQADLRQLLERVDRILMLDPGSTQLTSRGLMLLQPDGGLRPLSQLSDGYRGTLSWVLDFIGWQFMAREYYAEHEDVPSIVLIDEVEQHLHPQWQRSVIGRLREQFPETQFIVSTHSPLCVLGSTMLADEDISLSYIERGVNADAQPYSLATSGLLPPRGQRADQVLNSYVFGLTSSRDEQTELDIRELSTLLSESEPTGEQRTRIKELEQKLEPLLGSAETPLEREVQRAALAAAERVLERKMALLSDEQKERLRAIEELAP